MRTYELKGVHTANFEADLFSRRVEYCGVSNVETVDPVLKRTPSIKRTVAEVPQFISLISFTRNLD